MFICHTICLYTSSGATGFGLLFRRQPLAASCPTLSDSVSLVSAACLPALLLKPIRSADLPVCPERSPPRPAHIDRPAQILKGHTHTLSLTHFLDSDFLLLSDRYFPESAPVFGGETHSGLKWSLTSSHTLSARRRGCEAVFHSGSMDG